MKKISGEVQFGAASKANLKVVVRVRPFNHREEESGARNVVNALDKHSLIFDPKEEEDGFFFKGARQRCRDINKKQPLEKKFVFEQVFGDEATNHDIYQATAHPLVDTLLQGYNCSVFAYGATGAGKTFTMLGQPECPGITSLTLQELYRRLNELKGQRLCEVAVSYLEVYNEMVRDLLGSGKSLALQEAGQQVMVPGLSLHKPSSAEELLQMLARGNRNRSQHATDANAESSRSHAVFQIFVRQQDMGAGKANVTISKLSMIDLAGSERGAATGFRGSRFKEGSSINKSLLALGNCINALADGHRHIPYRNSKLTRLLKDSLGGNCCSVMIAAMSPASTSYEDTYNTLRYAERAKTIRTTIRSNVRNVNQHVSDYIKIIEDMKEEISRLQDMVKQYKQKEEEWESQGKVEKLKEVEVMSEEEMEAQRQLQDVSGELKALRQELLQLESAYRVTDLKRYHWSARLAKVRVISFASRRLDKTLNKCERTIHSLEVKLTQTAHRIEMVQGKVTISQAKLQAVQEALNSFGLEPGQPSKCSQALLEKHQASVMLRDRHQLGIHCQTMLEEALKEQNTLEQLNHVLLTAVRDLYLQFNMKDQCCPQVQGIFQRVVEGLDECRIAWADQQRVPEEGGSTAASGSQELVLPLDPIHWGCLPSLTEAVISPTVMVEPTTSFRKSSIMAAVNGPVLPRHHMAEESRSLYTPTSISTTTHPRPVSPLPLPQECQPGEAKEERSQSTALASPLHSLQRLPSVHSSVHERGSAVPATPLQHERQLTGNGYIIPVASPARPLNTTIDIPPVSQLSSLPSPSIPRALNVTIDLPSSGSSTTITRDNSPLKPLNTTFEMETTNTPTTLVTPARTNTSVSAASQLSSVTACTPPVKLPDPTANIPSASKLSSFSMPSISTSGFPSASQLSTITVPTMLKPLATTTSPPSASKLSSFTNATMNHTTNNDLPSATNFTTDPTDTRPLRTVHSESKLYHRPTEAHHLHPRNTDNTAVPEVAPTHSTTTAPTTTSASGPHVVRKLFDGKPAGLDSTFCITIKDTMETEESNVLADAVREAQPLSEGSLNMKAAAVPTLVPPPNNQPSVHTMPEQRSSKPLQLVRGIRGMANRRGIMNRTPYKPLIQPFTPGKAMGGGLRRSVSTPSLAPPAPSIKQPTTTTKKKLKSLATSLQRTSSFVTKRTSNQENVPPHHVRRPHGLMGRGASPSSHTRSPGHHLGKT